MSIYIPDTKIRETNDYKETKTVLQKFAAIEEKNKCIRVQFLDWLSKKLASWGVKVKQVSDNIHSPCKIKL